VEYYVLDDDGWISVFVVLEVFFQFSQLTTPNIPILWVVHANTLFRENCWQINMALPWEFTKLIIFKTIKNQTMNWSIHDARFIHKFMATIIFNLNKVKLICKDLHFWIFTKTQKCKLKNQKSNIQYLKITLSRFYIRREINSSRKNLTPNFINFNNDFVFVFSLLWCSHIGNHLWEDLGGFG